MINCLLIKININSRGLPVRSYRTLTASELSFGRAAECTVHLPDPRISMHHAVIKRVSDGEMHLVSINGELEVESATKQSVPLTQGTQVMIGPYRLTVEPAPPDVNLAISLELAHRLPDDFQDIKARTHEALPGASKFKRQLSLWMVAFIVLFFIGLPVAQNLIPQMQTSIKQLPFGFDRVWSPERISSSHRHFASQCVNCHQTLTKQVSDQACMECHRDTSPHIANKELQRHAFNEKRKFIGTTRCAECHREHKAPTPLTKQDDGMCVKCHGNIKSINVETKLPNIHDFDRDHPEFKLTLKAGDATTKAVRVPQSDKSHLVENSGLKFPHSQHTGKVQGPDGMWDVRELSCTTCHQPEGREMRFKALSYKRDCMSCHAAELEVGPKDARIKVPHGTEDNVYSALKLYAPKDFSRYSETLKTEGCAYCHDVIESDKENVLPWQVAPLFINPDWFSKAQFNHALHRTQQCTSCHKVEESESSADIAMPDRQSCLRCHSGNSQKYKRIASGCMSCHDFHKTHAGEPNLTSSDVSKKDMDVLLSTSNHSE